MVYTPRYVTAAQVYQKTGLTSTDVDLTVNDTLIEDAELELETLTGRRYDGENVLTEFIDGAKEDAIGRSVPNSFGISTGTGIALNSGRAKSLRISNYPIQEITTFLRLNSDGTTAKTYATLSAASITAGTFDTTDYWLETQYDTVSRKLIPNGRIVLKLEDVIPGKANYKVVYKFGYGTVATPAVPIPVRALAACLAGIRAWVRLVGGNYDRINSYSVPEQSVTKGDIYNRAKQNIDTLKMEADQLLDRIGRRPRVLFVGSGADR